MNRAYLLQPAFDGLWAAARCTWERNGGLGGELRIPRLTPEEATEIQGLIAPARRRNRAPLRAGDELRFRLAVLDTLLRDGPGVTLEDALVAHGGALTDRVAQREALQAATEELWRAAFAHRAAERPEIRAWLQDARAKGLVTRAARDLPERRRLLLATLDVLATLPRDGVELSRLASELTGDSHALDWNTPLGRLAAAAVAGSIDAPRSQTAGQWRVTWSRVGVACDDLSAVALTLGLRPLPQHPIAQAALAMAGVGEPHVLTLRSLIRQPLRFQPQTVFVCENPAVVSYAAGQLGTRSAPLVCTGGWPSTAVTRLLRLMTDSGCRLRMQGDFDWEGARIHRHMRHAHGAGSWRYTADVYGSVAAGRVEAVRLPETDALTDSGALSAVMRKLGIAVYEEDLVGALADDLAADPRQAAA